MTYKKFLATIVSFTLSLFVFVGVAVVPVSALSVGLYGGVSAGTSSTTATVGTNTETRAQKIITRSDTAIATRITVLNNLSARIAGLKNVSATEKANIANEVATNISGLSALKAKIDGETDVTTLLSDEKSIATSYRIYMLVIPQGYIAAAADRVVTVEMMLASISAKLQVRITAAQSAGKDVTSLTATLADMNAKITDAKTQATNAQNGIAPLTPDNGNVTVATSNRAALVSARADIKVATKDLETARQDARMIMKGLIAFHLNATASSSTTQTH